MGGILIIMRASSQEAEAWPAERKELSSVKVQNRFCIPCSFCRPFNSQNSAHGISKFTRKAKNAKNKLSPVISGVEVIKEKEYRPILPM
jgi:hypothetical protein